MHRRSCLLSQCVSGSMEHRRKWLSLCPVVPLCGTTDYDEALKNIFAFNPAITGDVLHAFLLRGYRVNVAVSELEQWICFIYHTLVFHI